MSAVLSIDRHARRALRLDAQPKQKFWFDPPIRVSDLLLVNAKGETVVGDGKGAILKSHGILTVGPTVEAAAWWYIALDNTCHTQLLAEGLVERQPARLL